MITIYWKTSLITTAMFLVASALYWKYTGFVILYIGFWRIVSGGYTLTDIIHNF